MGLPSEPRVLAVVPARGGSKGLPGKNLREVAGASLLEHALRFAARSPAIARTIVSTDSEEIADAARRAGGDVPFLRPAELARDETPMWPVLRHALAHVDPDSSLYDVLVLLDPTSPLRLAEDLDRAIRALVDHPDADGAVSVYEPGFSPVWQCVVERNGLLEHLVPEGAAIGRRQDAPRVLVIAGVVYAWGTGFVAAEPETWLNGRMRPVEVPARRAVSVDGPEDLALLEGLLAAGLVQLGG